MLLILLSIILISIVIFQFALAYFVYSKFSFLQLFKFRGVGLRHLYVVGVFFSPLLAPIIILAVLFILIKSLFEKKTVTPIDLSSVDGIDSFIKGFK